MIFDIQRFSTHDGPGIRTVVFFKGCPLRCGWCENPESQSGLPELLYTRKDCVGCRSCLGAESGGAVRAAEDGGIEVLRGVNPPAALGRVCPAKALRLAGEAKSPEEILELVLKDRDFYSKSGGGLTVSGGEPLAQIDFVEDLLRMAAAEGVDLAVESCLAVGTEALDRLLDLPIHWLADLKHVDPAAYRRGTGGDVAQSLANLSRLARGGGDLTLRVPLVPGFNDDAESARAILEFAAGLDAPAGSAAGRRVDLLPYHDLAAGKYAALGRAYPYPLGLRVDSGFPERCAEIGRSLGLDVTIGG